MEFLVQSPSMHSSSFGSTPGETFQGFHSETSLLPSRTTPQETSLNSEAVLLDLLSSPNSLISLEGNDSFRLALQSFLPSSDFHDSHPGASEGGAQSKFYGDRHREELTDWVTGQQWRSPSIDQYSPNPNYGAEFQSFPSAFLNRISSKTLPSTLEFLSPNGIATPETGHQADTPIVGIIDTGFDPTMMDIEFSRITWGQDRVEDLTSDTDSFHGSAIANIIGAQRGNGDHVDGVNDQASLWLSDAVGSGNWTESLIEFVDTVKASGQKNAIANLSFDLVTQTEDGDIIARHYLTEVEQEAIEYARQAGILLVVAAGNDGSMLSALAASSQQFDNVLTVGAVEDGDRAAYSNIGMGLGIVAEGGTADNPLAVFANSDTPFFGTSAAAAQVSGAASRIWEVNSDLSYRQVIDVLQSTATDLDDAGWDDETGFGQLNLDAALEKASTLASDNYDPDDATIQDTPLESDDDLAIERPLMGMDMGGGHHMPELMKLVPTNGATHTAANSGSWFDPKTWGGQVPGNNARVVIPKGVTVNYDGESNARLFTVRIDGDLSFDTRRDTRMLVDTMVVMSGGGLDIGTKANPVQANATTDIVFAPVNPNQRMINKSWDTAQLSRGLITMHNSEVDVWGTEKTPYLTLKDHAKAGDRQLTFDQAVPSDWKVGDRIVLTGTTGRINWRDKNRSHEDNSFFEDEVLTITGINGNRVTFSHNDVNGNALRFDHSVPEGYGLEIYVANLTRNVRFSTEAGDNAQIMERGHIMFMDQDVDFHNAGMYDMGRSNKDRIANPNTNPRSRYPIHFHETLRHANGYNEAPARVTGNAIDGSPGWGYVIHGTKAVVEDNVSFDVLGAHYVTEDGDEIAEFRRNIAIKAVGAKTDPGANLLQLDRNERGRQRDVGVMGYGFWLDSPYSAFALEDNIVASTNETAYLFYGHNDNEFIEDKRDENFKTPTPGLMEVPVSTLPPNLRHIAKGNNSIHAWKVPNPGPWSGNIAYNSESGAEVRGVLRDDKGNDSYFNLGHQTRATIDNMKVWGVRHLGLGLGYAAHINVENSLFLGDMENPVERGKYFVGADKDGMYGHGIFLAKNSRYVTLKNNRIEGFEVGAVVQQTQGQGLHLASEENFGPGQLIGGYFANNTYNLGAAPGRNGDGARHTPMYFNNPFNPFFEVSGDVHFESPSGNKAPIARFSLSSQGQSTFEFNGKASIDPDYPVNTLSNNRNTIASYAWDFNNDGVFDDWGWTVDRKLNQGTHNVSLTVFDHQGLSATKRATIEVTGNNSQIISQTDSQPNPAGQSGGGWTPTPNPTPNPTPDPVPDANPAPAPAPVLNPQPEPEPVPDPIPKPIPEPDPTPISRVTTLQAEDARLSGAVVRSKAGADGRFVDFRGNDGAFIEWVANVESAGNYELAWRYTLGQGDRPLALSINGETVEASVDFPNTRNWQDWQTLTRSMNLKAGQNTIRLTAIGQSGGDFDSLTIAPISSNSSEESTPSISEPGLVASPDPTSTPASTPRPVLEPEAEPQPDPASPVPSTVTRLQAEDARLSRMAVRSDAPTADGRFVDFRRSTGAFVEWSVNAEQAGDYELAWRYSQGDGDRPLNLSVNGQLIDTLAVPNTESWNDWDVLAQTVSLTTGNNTIRLTSAGKDGANIDYMEVAQRG